MAAGAGLGGGVSARMITKIIPQIFAGLSENELGLMNVVPSVTMCASIGNPELTSEEDIANCLDGFC
eukprot:2109494-Amphidinium_carterae.1